MRNQASKFHTPVLLQEAIDYLNVSPGNLFIDATLGGAGHALAILKKGGRVLGLDWDKEAIKYAKNRLAKACPPKDFWLEKASFANLKKIWQEKNLERPAGILFDLGVSSHQLETEKRGFGFRQNTELDMRMDLEGQKVTAADLLKVLSKKELYELTARLGEEQLARPIAGAIVLARRKKPITTTTQLKNLVAGIYRHHRKRSRHIHPATKTFQALRIAVNDELNNLKEGLNQAFEILDKKGRLVVISFHGGEDRIVKHFFKNKKEQGLAKVLIKKPIVPSREEISINPRSRSAKMRAIEKLKIKYKKSKTQIKN